LLLNKKIRVEHLRGHSSLALDSVGLLVVGFDSYFLVGNFFAALVDFKHSDYYSMKNWGGFATLHCKCWSMGCSLEDSYYGPHNLHTLDLQMKTWDKSQWCSKNENIWHIPQLEQSVEWERCYE
jgi:hypothetical protein